MVQTETDDFTVDWEDPADAELTWDWDQMHWPRPAPPLTVDVIKKIFADIFNARSIAVSGYFYTLNAAPPPPTPEVVQRGPFDVWENDYVPLVQEACRRLRKTDYEGMSAAELAESLDLFIQEANDAFRYTMVVVYAFMGPTFALVDFSEKEFGPDGPQLLATLLQGHENGSSAAGAGLGELADLAKSLPEVGQALREGRHSQLESVAGGLEFMSRLLSYLEEYGWRAESWGLAHFPTWAEDPNTVLMLLARYLSDAILSPAEAIERSIKQREEAMREVESRLSGDRLAEFKKRLEACAGHVQISEGRARWQLTIIGSLRVPFLALGRKLVKTGVLDEPNDVFYLSVQELKEAARKPSQSQKALVATRKATLKRCEQLTPPPFVGIAPSAEPPPEMQPLLSKFFGLGVTPSTEENVINGNAASRGVVRGRARVIHDLSEAGRLQKGEVLVCRSTAPPWTPLFAIAAAIVTDTGGVLSHSAICAREYSIPCVVGTQTGTRQIPDGAMITVDGADGTVRIEA